MKLINIIFSLLFVNTLNVYTQCNGHNSLCTKKYDEVAYLTTHNSYNSSEDNFIYPNQNHNIITQLNNGVRALMIDVYDVNGVSRVYHGFSLLGSAPLTSFLTDIKTFLDDNPNEIVTIILECYTTANKIEEAMISSGLITQTYSYTSNEWPTLQKMIDDDTRLVILSDRNDASSTQNWYHYVWDYAVETHFTAHKLNDFNCNFNRGNVSNNLFILNHFITDSTLGIGLEEQAIIANSNPYFINRVLECQNDKNKFPNFITVDFYDKGDGLNVVNQLNQVTLSLNNIEKKDSNIVFITYNSSNSIIKISGITKEENYIIYNYLGAKIVQGKTSSNGKINIDGISNGIYFLSLEQTRMLKFIKN